MDKGFGKYDVYAVAGSMYCYRGTSVLKNRFGLRDMETLKKLEADISAVRQSDLLTHPIQGRFSPNHLCRIHRYLLGDIYPFAGHFRREDIMKGNTRFLTHGEIKAKLSKLLEELAEELSKTFDVQKRSELAVRMQQIILDDNAYVFCSHLRMTMISRANVTGLTAHPCDYYEITADLDIN